MERLSIIRANEATSNVKSINEAKKSLPPTQKTKKLKRHPHAPKTTALFASLEYICFPGRYASSEGKGETKTWKLQRAPQLFQMRVRKDTNESGNNKRKMNQDLTTPKKRTLSVNTNPLINCLFAAAFVR